MKTATFGEELRRWRTTRGVSQLDLAVTAEVSQRHLSFLETGRSKPSPEIVVHLGRTLDLGLRDQNLLLGAAGYAPAYAERGLDDPDLDQVRDVLTNLVAAHGHFPAYIVDRQWDLVLANPMALLIMGAVDPPPPASVAANLFRLTLHPEGLRPMIVNWEQVATTLIHRLEREVTHSPNDSGLQALFDEIRAYPGIESLPTRSLLPEGNDLLVPVHASLGGIELRFFTTITTIGAPFDITLEGLRLETLLPADAETDSFLRQTNDGLS